MSYTLSYIMLLSYLIIYSFLSLKSLVEILKVFWRNTINKSIDVYSVLNIINTYNIYLELV